MSESLKISNEIIPQPLLSKHEQPAASTSGLMLPPAGKIVHLIKKREEKFDRKEQEARQIAPGQTGTRVEWSGDKANYTNRLDKCEECKSKDLVIKQREGTIVCEGCGLVQQSRIIDESSEWRTFSSETSNNGTNPSRVGGKLNPYLSNYGIDTQVKGANASDIQKWADRSSLSAKDKQISKGLRAIKEMAGRLNLKEPTQNRACEIYNKIEVKGIRGASLMAKVATVIFIASRIEKQPKGIKEILAIDQVSQKELSSCYKKIKELIPELKSQVHLDASQITDQVANRL